MTIFTFTSVYCLSISTSSMYVTLQLFITLHRNCSSSGGWEKKSLAKPSYQNQFQNHNSPTQAQAVVYASTPKDFPLDGYFLVSSKYQKKANALHLDLNFFICMLGSPSCCTALMMPLELLWLHPEVSRTSGQKEDRYEFWNSQLDELSLNKVNPLKFQYWLNLSIFLINKIGLSKLSS